MSSLLNDRVRQAMIELLGLYLISELFEQS